MIFKITLICLLIFVLLVLLAKIYISTLSSTDKIIISLGRYPNKIVEFFCMAIGLMGIISLVMVFISGIVFIINI